MNARYARPARPCRDQRPGHGASGSVRGTRVGSWLALWLPGRGGEGAQAGAADAPSLSHLRWRWRQPPACARPGWRAAGQRSVHDMASLCGARARPRAWRPGASGLGDHAGRMAGSSRPVTEQAGKAGAVWPLRDDEGRLSAIAGIEIWPSRGSLIRHAPRCSGNMGSGWGGGRLGSAPRPADCDERRARSGSGPCVEHDCPLLLCATRQTRAVHHHLASECNHLQ